MLKEFREFAIKGNVVDLAVGIIIGAAFGAIVTSLVGDIIMPPVGALLGGVDFSGLMVILEQGTPAGPYATAAAAQEAGAVAIYVGSFINTIINFLIVALAMFFVVKAINRLKREEPAAPPAPAAPDPQQKLIETLERLTSVLDKQA